LTIPLALISDFVIKDKSFSTWYLVGAFVVLAGFLFVNIRRNRQSSVQQQSSLRGYDMDQISLATSPALHEQTNPRLPHGAKLGLEQQSSI